MQDNLSTRSPLELLKSRPYLKICAPMVRYSKLPFRELVKSYDTDIAFTPMILADSFTNSDLAREMELQTTCTENALVVQFASSNAIQLAHAALLVAPYCAGIDLNSGCPQSWACKEGLGASLMSKPELVSDMVSQVKRITAPINNGKGTCCSVKIRIHSDLKETIEFAKRAEKAGVDFITVHGRTKSMKSNQPVNLDAIKLVKENLSIPVFANGDIFSLTDSDKIAKETGCDGVMSARGLLENPGLFQGHTQTPDGCIEKFVRLSIGYGGTFFVMHHHLMYMMEGMMSKSEKKTFNSLCSIAGIVDFLEKHYGMELNT